MKKDCIFVYLTYIKKTNNCYQYIADYKRVFAVLILVCLVFAVVFSSVVPSEAGMVYGHVFLDGKLFPSQDTLTFLDAKGNRFTIKTDQNGNYSSFLPTGVYTVIFTQEDVEWTATIRSYPNPIKQDIRMKRQ